MDGFINNIWTGRAGLAKTYWGYGFLGGLESPVPTLDQSPPRRRQNLHKAWFLHPSHRAALRRARRMPTRSAAWSLMG